MRSEISALVTIISALALAGAATLSAAASAPVATTTNLTPPGEVLIVDDDGLQCPGAETSIQAAIDKASAGAVVQVCPGVYTEFVHIDKSLTLIGQPETIAGLDCFAESASSLDDLDPTRYALLSRPEGQTGNLVTVATGGVTVAGLVLQNARTRVGNIEDAAIDLQSGSAGATVHHNLFRLNGLGVDLGSDGSAATRVHHNCLRDNDFGMASQRQDFVEGTVDHNETFRTLRQAYEVGWPYASTRDSVFASNVSLQDDIGFTVTNSSNVSIVDNDVHPRRYGVSLGGRRSALTLPLVPGNASIDITDNRIEGGRFLGIFFAGSDLPSHGVVVSDNKIADFAPVLPGDPGFGIGLALNALVEGVEILENVMENNVVGLSVNPTNSGIVVRDNTVTGNVQQGIFSRAGVVGALYKDNLLLGNAPSALPGDPIRADARDDNPTANTWVDNVCQTDIPFGSICGVG